MVFLATTGIGTTSRGVGQPRSANSATWVVVDTVAGHADGGATEVGMRTLVTVLVLDEGVIEIFEAFRHRVTDPPEMTADWVQAAWAAIGNGIVNAIAKTVTSENLRTRSS